MKKVAINGFGRIGRLFFRKAFGNPNFEIVAINDLGDVENLAYLLQYDTVYGRYKKNVSFIKSETKNAIIVDAKDADGELGRTVLMGINEEAMGTCAVTSNASCTTNGISPVVAVLSEKLGIAKALMTTAHAYTNTQTMVD